MKNTINPWPLAQRYGLTSPTSSRLLRDVVTVEVYCTKCGYHTDQPGECPTCKTGDHLDRGDLSI